MFEIIIKNLKLFGYHGVNPEEKRNGQEFLFNIRIKLSKNTFRINGKYEDNITATVNYSDIISLIKEVNGKNNYDLLETLCEELSLKILKHFPMILKAEVKVEKTAPPINEDIESVGVKVIAGRNRFISEVQDRNIQEKNLNRESSILFYLSIGSNLADREENLRAAVKKLESKQFIRVLKVSSIYESEPMYVKKQSNFYNVVLKGEIFRGYNPGNNGYNAFEFLGFLKSIEQDMGRKAFGQRYGPRIIDLDLLYFDDKEIISDLLILPHPGIIERKFVLVPLSEIEPDFIINKKKVADLIKAVSTKEKVFKVKKW